MKKVWKTTVKPLPLSEGVCVCVHIFCPTVWHKRIKLSPYLGSSFCFHSCRISSDQFLVLRFIIINNLFFFPSTTTAPMSLCHHIIDDDDDDTTKSLPPRLQVNSRSAGTHDSLVSLRVKKDSCNQRVHLLAPQSFQTHLMVFIQTMELAQVPSHDQTFHSRWWQVVVASRCLIWDSLSISWAELFPRFGRSCTNIKLISPARVLPESSSSV